MKKLTIFLAAFLVIFFFGCARKGNIYEIRNGNLIIKNGKLKISISRDSKTFLILENQVIKSEKNIGFDYVVCDDDTVFFNINFDKITEKQIENEHGKGWQLLLTGLSLNDGYGMERELVFEKMDKYPDCILTKVSYKNIGTSPLALKKISCCNYEVDASLMDASAKPFEFMLFCGSSHKWGIDDFDTLCPGFSKEHTMGIDTSTRFGGGVPIVDLWTRKMGIALAQIEPKPIIVSFPVKVNDLGKTELSMCKEYDLKLEPGKSISLPKTALMFHHLDYFDPFKTYASLLADQSIKKVPFSPKAYDMFWITWGYGFDFTKDDIIRVLPKLKELGFQWIVLDDKWFDNYGDWMPRKKIFPGGEKDLKAFVKKLHDEGFKVQIWWYPNAVQVNSCPPKKVWWVQWECGPSEVAKKNPDMFVVEKNNHQFLDPRFLSSICPATPEAKEWIAKTTERLMKDYDFDGIKIDALYEVPPCYNPAHRHADPEESYEQFPELLKIINDVSKKIKPECVNLICNCGSVQDFFQLVYIDQPETSDPTSSFQNRSRTKYLKALLGPSCPVFGDVVEVVNDEFASVVGVGAIPASEFAIGKTKKVRNTILTPEREELFKKWFPLYKEKMLVKGNYLNLYDIIYDKPETHIIQKGDTMYYSIYAKEFKGKIELRGLDKKDYSVIDYVNNKSFGKIDGRNPNIDVEFKEYLLIECVPE
jgi:alpha-galactosidase